MEIEADLGPPLPAAEEAAPALDRGDAPSDLKEAARKHARRLYGAATVLRRVAGGTE